VATRDDRPRRDPSDDGSTPPSFAPGGRGAARPSADDATPVGTPPAGPARTSRPGRPATPSRPAAQRPPSGGGADPAPASFAPRSATARPADPSGPAGARPTGGRSTAPRAVPGDGAPARTSTRAGAAPAAEASSAVGRPPRRSTPAGPGRPAATAGSGSAGTRPPHGPDGATATPAAPRRRRRRRVVVLSLVLVLVLLIAWPIGLVMWANGKIQHTAALSGAADTSGTTYLLAGSDSREDGVIEDSETVGARTDTILLLHVPESGPAALISLPRDTYVQIPGYDPNKLNAAFSWGGAPLLVQTVEQLTGMTVDHYVEIGFGGVEDIVDALGGVELCLDESTGITFPVNDTNSGLVWDAPGCKTVDGVQALAFSRMRYADPSGDIGRGQRQRQLISAVAAKAEDPSLLVKPTTQVALIDTGLGVLTTSEGTDILDLGRLALAFRSATGPGGVTGTPPIASLDYRPGGVGSTVLLDESQVATFFTAVRDGTLTPGSVVGGVPTS
jgi:LCP family protein required for cell wall assembly